VNPKLLNLLNFYQEWKTIPMKFKALSFFGITFPAITLLVGLWGCSVNQDFVALMEQTNTQIIKEWSEDPKISQIEIETRAVEITKVFAQKSYNLINSEPEELFFREFSKRLAAREFKLKEAIALKDAELIKLNQEAYERMMDQLEPLAKVFNLEKKKEWLNIAKEAASSVIAIALKATLGFG